MFSRWRPPQCVGNMLKASEEEIEAIREYFEWQAGFSKWATFYEHYATARKQLEALGALPLASVTPLSG